MSSKSIFAACHCHNVISANTISEEPPPLFERAFWSLFIDVNNHYLSIIGALKIHFTSRNDPQEIAKWVWGL